MENSPDFVKLYFTFLYEKVGMNNRNGKSYHHLAEAMFQREFYSSVKEDSTRLRDGLALRERYRKLLGANVEEAEAVGPCNLLEVLVSFAMVIEEDIMTDDHEGDRTKVWFWAMIDNSGLYIYSDPTYEYMDNATRVRRKLDVILDRTYEPNGEGGLFPIHNARADQRTVSMWYQANTWLSERRLGDDSF